MSGFNEILVDVNDKKQEMYSSKEIAIKNGVSFGLVAKIGCINIGLVKRMYKSVS